MGFQHRPGRGGEDHRPGHTSQGQPGQVRGAAHRDIDVSAGPEGAGVDGAPRKRRDFGDIAGTWKPDKAVESALAAQDRVDTDLWR